MKENRRCEKWKCKEGIEIIFTYLYDLQCGSFWFATVGHDVDIFVAIKFQRKKIAKTAQIAQSHPCPCRITWCDSSRGSRLGRGSERTLS